MRVSYRFLCELLPGLTASPAEVAERLTSAGLEIEATHAFGASSEGIVLAEVRKIEPHPTRDKLRLVTVQAGAPEQRIVCGASNVPPPGDLVVLAPLGTHLPAVSLTIEPRAIGGVESAGMLCSEEELGLAESAEGILVFPAGAAAPGTPLSRFIPTASDTIFEVGITPNRPDALGHVGVARDLAALMGTTFTLPSAGTPAKVAEQPLDALLTVRLEEPERCPLYGAAVVDGVTIAPSPPWLRYRLHALGVRPISNVVDVTNLLMLEFGQPMHAFDHALVEGAQIVVRAAKAGERFKTLDGVDRTLTDDDLVIADARAASALAGVMGGENSEIRSTTRRVVLECAYFAPRGIRRTSRRHALSTDSSYRFERGTDWAAVPHVLERAKTLLSELAGGAPTATSLFVRGAALQKPVMRLRSRRLDAILGTRVPFAEATAILGRLGLTVKSVEKDAEGGEAAIVEGASHRPDIAREADLIEEVARIRGFDAIPTVLPAILPQLPRTTTALERRVLREAVALGLSEVVAYSFVSEKELSAVGAPKAVVTLQNPMSEDRSVLRTSLLPGLLDVLKRARRHGERSARLFGIGARFLRPGTASESDARPRAEADRAVLPEERPSFAAVLAGPRPAHLSKAEDVDVLDAKGLAIELVERLTERVPDTEPATTDRPPHLHPRGAARLVVDGKVVGSFGPLHPDVIDALDLDGPAQVVELDLAVIEALGFARPKYRPIPRLPATSRDVSIVASESVPAAQIEREIRSAAGELCESVELFDVFTGGNVPAGSRALGYHVVYRDPKAASDPDNARTLTDAEVDKQHERVRAAAGRLGELRS